MATKKVKMLTSIAGPTWSAKPGDVLEMESKQADRFIEGGLAEAAAKGAEVTKCHRDPEREKVVADEQELAKARAKEAAERTKPVEKAAARTKAED